MFKFSKKQLKDILPAVFSLLALAVALSIGIFFTISIQIVIFIFWCLFSYYVLGEGDFDLGVFLSILGIFVSLFVGNILYLIFSNFDMISNIHIQILR